MKRVFRFQRILLAFLVCLAIPTSGRTQTEPIEGIRDNTPQVHALVNAKIVQGPGKVIEKGSVVIRNGTIQAVGTDIAIPPDARIWDYDGLTLYPGLIESYSQQGLAKDKKDGNGQDSESKAAPDYWNPNVHPEESAMTTFKPSKEDLETMRALGFTAAVITPDEGIFSGGSVMVSLKDGDANEQVLRDDIAQNIMFKRPESGGRSYPNSQMGVIALIRQTFLDAQWYQRAQQAYAINPAQERPEINVSLQALQPAINQTQPVLFHIEDDLNCLRALKVANEFKLNTWILGSGHEYRQLDAIKATGVPFIVPVNFPEAPDVDDPEDARDVSLLELSHWDAAPENPAQLHRAGVQIVLSLTGLKNPKDFHKNIRTAIERGLPKDAALAALTTTPAKLLRMETQLGTVTAGKIADLVVTDGDLFEAKTTIFDVWIDGERYEIERRPEVDPRGKWQITFTFPDERTSQFQLDLKGEATQLKGTLLRDSTAVKLKKIEVDHKRMTLVLPGDSLGFSGVIRLSGSMTREQLSGTGILPDGRDFEWSAQSRQPVEPDKDKSDEKKKPEAQESKPLAFPLGAYAFSKPAQWPEQSKHVFVDNATIWTCGPDGIIENADMLISDGKITRVGRNLEPPTGAAIIDGKGKHVTPGLIDAHSHSGIDGGVNESGQAVTAEVRIQDVIDNNDIALYRELAGGLTAVNQLHGSANPIGGQNSVIKLRWGASPEAMRIDDAIPGIKFALGENVKQSNWGDDFTTRYPQTRMGVEQIIRDRFKAALDYEKEWEFYRASKNKEGVVPPRRDLELEALLEILHGKRLVHSHSYRQDEILMLVRVAEDFGFTIGTFQHVLEGYKVAEALASHGAGASTFSDWWGYKFEVYDAIPYNGALMHDVGVVVSFNSDSNELARRMNLEAAKAVKYGGVSEQEALKFVTLNPAKQLRIDHRVGSLEAGKDGDFVVWSGSPLSVYTVCEQTWIEGRKYFDLQHDKEMRKQVMAERARLIQKVLTSDGNTNSGNKGSSAMGSR